MEANATEAARWFLLAARQRHAGAQYFLGLMLQKGVGVERNLEASHGWYSRSAEGGNRNAMLELSKIYAMGLGVPADEAAAKAWRDKAGFDKK